MQETIRYEESLKTKGRLLQIRHYPLHVHSKDLQIIYVLEGELDLQVASGHYPLSQGDIHIIHTEDVHGWNAVSRDNRVVVVDIDTAYYDAFFPGLSNIVFSSTVTEAHSDSATRRRLLEDLFALVFELSQEGADYERRVKEKTIALLTTMRSHYRGFTINPTSQILEHRTPYDQLHVNRISNIVQYIYVNYPYKLSLSQIAEQENLSLHYLSHLFQRFVGISFREYVSMARVEMSEYALLDTDRSISSLAQGCGFSNSQYYINAFIRWFGMHPKAFRQRFKKNVYGKMDPEITPFPLDTLQDLLPEDMSIPEFQKAKTRLQRIDLPVPARLAGPFTSLPWYPKWLDQINQSLTSAFLHPATVPEDIIAHYLEHEEQQPCLRLLETLAAGHSPEAGALRVIDEPDDLSGIFTINGMSKPIYHLLRLLATAGDHLVEAGQEYFLMARENALYLFLFNPYTDQRLQFGCNLNHEEQDYKITEQRLSATRTCITYWTQLNRPSVLYEEDRQHIDRMTGPQISFALATAMNNRQYTCLLEPLDIVCLKIASLE